MSGNEPHAWVAGFIVGFLLGVFMTAVVAEYRIEKRLVSEGVGCYVVDPVTGERSVKWWKRGEK